MTLIIKVIFKYQYYILTLLFILIRFYWNIINNLAFSQILKLHVILWTVSIYLLWKSLKTDTAGWPAKLADLTTVKTTQLEWEERWENYSLSLHLGSSQQAEWDGNSGPQVWSVLWPHIRQHCRQDLSWIDLIQLERFRKHKFSLFFYDVTHKHITYAKKKKVRWIKSLYNEISHRFLSFGTTWKLVTGIECVCENSLKMVLWVQIWISKYQRGSLSRI